MPDKPFSFLPAALNGVSSNVVIRSLESADNLTFKAHANHKAEASAMTSVFGAFTLRGTAKDGKPDGAAMMVSTVNLNHLVVWLKDPQTTAKLFTDQGQPYAVPPFDTDLDASPDLLSDSSDTSAISPLTR